MYLANIDSLVRIMQYHYDYLEGVLLEGKRFSGRLLTRAETLFMSNLIRYSTQHRISNSVDLPELLSA